MHIARNSGTHRPQLCRVTPLKVFWRATCGVALPCVVTTKQAHPYTTDSVNSGNRTDATKSSHLCVSICRCGPAMGYKVGNLPDINQPANILEEIVWHKAREIESFRQRQSLPILQVCSCASTTSVQQNLCKNLLLLQHLQWVILAAAVESIAAPLMCEHKSH